MEQLIRPSCALFDRTTTYHEQIKPVDTSSLFQIKRTKVRNLPKICTEFQIIVFIANNSYDESEKCFLLIFWRCFDEKLDRIQAMVSPSRDLSLVTIFMPPSIWPDTVPLCTICPNISHP